MSLERVVIGQRDWAAAAVLARVPPAERAQLRQMIGSRLSEHAVDLGVLLARVLSGDNREHCLKLLEAFTAEIARSRSWSLTPSQQRRIAFVVLRQLREPNVIYLDRRMRQEIACVMSAIEWIQDAAARAVSRKVG